MALFRRVVAALCKADRLNDAVNLLHRIRDIANASAFVTLLQCCIQKKALDEGKRIHALIRNQPRLRKDVFLHKALLQMYVRCGSLVDARSVFNGMVEKDVFSWNCMITAYRKQGLSEKALALFHEMQRNGSGVLPDKFSFSSVVPACAGSASLEKGVDIHRLIIRSGFHSHIVVTNALIDMYAKFGKIQEARQLFDKMKDRDAFSWNTMIAGYAQNGLHEEALEVFDGMRRNNVAPNDFTFASVFTACAISASLEEGLQIHGKLIISGFHSDVVVTTALISMYANCGNTQKARQLFDKMNDRNAFSWNTMITGYAQNGLHEEALEVFEEMQRSDVAPSEITFASVLKAYASVASLEESVEIHGNIIRSGCHSNVVVTNALINMYANFGNIQKARQLFDKMMDRNTISWNTMITGYAQNGLHEEARELFDIMEDRNTISFTAMITGYTQSGLHEDALEVFEGMQRNDVPPNEVTFTIALAACVSSVFLEEGVDIHRKIIKSGFHSNVVLTSALIKMYAKFRNVQKARVMFDKLQQRHTISSNSMITRYAQNGLHVEALEVFEGMQQNDVAPDEITFASVLP